MKKYNYYAIRDWGTNEVVSIYKTTGWLSSPRAENISEVEYETYEVFGIPASEKGVLGMRGCYYAIGHYGREK